MYKGSEHFSINGHEISLTIKDFWIWAYSDLTNNIRRSVLAEYIVATALEIIHINSESSRTMWRPYDLLTKDGLRVEVKSAASVQSWDAKHPEFISFRIAPARLPDETGDYKRFAPKQRNSDLYVFSIFTGMNAEDSPLNLDLWEFYVLPTKILDKEKPTQKTITFSSLLKLGPVWSDYYGLNEAIQKAMEA